MGTSRSGLRMVAALIVMVSATLLASPAGAVEPGWPKPRTLTMPPPATFVIQGGEAPADVVAAVEYAAHRWAQYITSDEPIVVELDWRPLDPGVGGIGTSGALHDFPGARLAGTWYPMALADALAGTDLRPGEPDVQLLLDSDVAWYTGAERRPGMPDLVSVAMHELGHGLGFSGWITRDATGTGSVGAGFGEGMPTAFDQLVDAAGSPILDLPSPSKALGDALVGGGLTWRGTVGTAANGGTPPALASGTGPDGTYPTLDATAFPDGGVDSLMNPAGEDDADRYPGAVAVGMLADMGWPFGPAALFEPRPTDDACPDGVPEDGFADVETSNTHEAAIDCVVAWGVTSGAGPSTYAPSGLVSRAQMASFIARLLDEAGGTLPEGDDAFTDDDGNAHEANIDRLAAAGIVSGRGDGTYDPDAPVTRAQMATLLVRAYEYRIDDTLVGGADFFWDDDGSTHAAEIDAAATFGFTGGHPDGTYGPEESVRRDQMASFLTRVLDLLVDDGLAAYPG